MNQILISLELLSVLTIQISNKLPDDVAGRVENADISALISDLSKAKSIDREGLNILRKKIALKAYFDQLNNYRNSLGGDVKIEAVRGKLKEPLVSRDLKKALDYEGPDAESVKQQQYKLFLVKYSLTDELVLAAGSLDEKIEKAELEIAKIKKAIDFFDEKMLAHRSKPDMVTLPKVSPLERPQLNTNIIEILDDILTEAGQTKANVTNESKKEISSIRIAERFAK